MGSRLSAISNGLPKILVHVFKKPLIDQLLSNCIAARINDVVIVTGYNNHIIEEHISKIETNVNIEIAYNLDWNLANGVSVLAAKNFIPDQWIVLHALCQFLQQRQGCVPILGTQMGHCQTVEQIIVVWA